MSAEATALTPTVLWAERKDKVYVTIEVQDCSKEGTTVSLQPDGGLTFRGVSGGGQAYALDLQLARGVDADGSKIAVTPRGVLLVVAKSAADASGPRWGRLLAAPGKPPHYVKVDWSKYVDEDEEAEGLNKDPMADLGGGFGGFGGGGGGGFDLSSLESMKNYGGGGEDEAEDDSDDEGMPELVKAEGAPDGAP